MQSARQVRLVLVTAPDRKTARGLAQKALRARLAACVSLVPQLESHYWWRDKLERSTEVLLLIKTTTAHLEALEVLLLAHHPYDTPEILALEVTRGTPRYLEWLLASVATPVTPTHPRSSRT
jgi:periplasmic divalent cation tolerance protein